MAYYWRIARCNSQEKPRLHPAVWNRCVGRPSSTTTPHDTDTETICYATVNIVWVSSTFPWSQKQMIMEASVASCIRPFIRPSPCVVAALAATVATKIAAATADCFYTYKTQLLLESSRTIVPCVLSPLAFPLLPACEWACNNPRVSSKGEGSRHVLREDTP